MADRDALTAADRGGARRYQPRLRLENRQQCAQAATDRLALSRCTTRPAEPQRPLPDAKISFGGEVSRLSCACPPGSVLAAREYASRDVCAMPADGTFAARRNDRAYSFFEMRTQGEMGSPSW